MERSLNPNTIQRAYQEQELQDMLAKGIEYAGNGGGFQNIPVTIQLPPLFLLFLKYVSAMIPET